MTTAQHVNYPHPAGFLAECEACENGPCQCGGQGTCVSRLCTADDSIMCRAAFPLGQGWENGLTEREMVLVDTEGQPERLVQGSPGWTWRVIEGPPELVARAIARLNRVRLIAAPEWYVGSPPRAVASDWVGVPLAPLDSPALVGAE